MALFPRCNNPVPVAGRHGVTLVGCHSCIQCRVAAQEHLCKLLEVEASKHKYVEFLTITYDDLHLPYIDTSYLYPFGYALRIPNRVIKKYNRKTKSFYFVEDKISKSFKLVDFSTIDTASMLRDYYSRIDKYYSRFPSRSRGIRNNSVVPILWYDDIRKYIGRLRKWFLKEYDEKIRYYIICEYGTQSFRPHYHILLFHDSPKARADFRIVRTLPQSTKENPREICVQLDLADLWVYGDTTSKVTDGNMQEYVSKYLTQHSNFPRVLDKFPQKSFHSILLGGKNRTEVKELLTARDFESLTTDYVVNKKGVRRSVAMSDAYYSQFAVRFTGSSSFNCDQTASLFHSVVYVARRFFATKGEIYDDGNVREFLLWLLQPSTSLLYKNIYQFRAIRWYAETIAKPIYNSTDSVNSLKSLLYATFHHYSLSSYLGLDFYQCLKLRFDFISWLDYQNMIQYFQNLENDKLFAYENYASMSTFTGTYDFNILKTRSIFQYQVQKANMAYTENIKHRAVVDSYKN
ncbi:MAG: replication initiator protein [Microviridae sp.]|nr:MAG: replication initiator protein [Microviridae sp.]